SLSGTARASRPPCLRVIYLVTGSSNARTDIKKLRPKIRAHFADLTGTRGFANLQTALHINKWLYICKRLVRSWLRSSIFTIRSRLEARPSIDIVELLVKDPRAFYELDWRKLEEIVAGAYKRKNFDVTLKPRSGDEGRDVIAVRHDVGSIRFFDQVKRYRPGHVVTLEEVH